MFQFRWFPTYTYGFSIRYMDMTPCGFPHSEIRGSKLICSSPRLIAAYHVFLRLLVPRHSPCALCSLTNYACSHDLIVVFVTLAFAIVIYTLIRSFIFRCSIFKVQCSSKLEHTNSLSAVRGLFLFQGICLFQSPIRSGPEN